MRVHRSFAFVDVQGFTALTEHQGDERAVELLSAFRALLRDICARRGVRIAKWLGDGVMLVCVETRPLLATILELHHVVCEAASPMQTVSIRSGITSGDVILMEGDDYIGHCVNVAARLCDLADGGEALAVPSVMEALPRWGISLTHRDVTLRGVEKPVTASSIRIDTIGHRSVLRPDLWAALGPHHRRRDRHRPRWRDGAVLLLRLPRHLDTPTGPCRWHTAAAQPRPGVGEIPIRMPPDRAARPTARGAGAMIESMSPYPWPPRGS